MGNLSRAKNVNQALSGSDIFGVACRGVGSGRKVLRGGSWNNNENNMRAANRNNNQPDNQNNNIGFRCVVGAAEPGVSAEGQVHRV